MKITRREFIGLAAVFGAASCARVREIDIPLIGEGEETFTFAAMNDLHVLDAASTAIVNRAVKGINANPDVRFTAVLGDLATAGRLAELNLAKGSLAKLEKPWFSVPGNHDVDMSSRNIYANYEKDFGDCTWTQEQSGWVFLGLDTCEGAGSDVTVRPERVAWLKKRVKHIKKDRPIGLFAHHPFNPNTQAYRVKNADEILGLFAGHNLKLVACGHWHGNQVEEKDGILYTTTACCSSTRDNFDKTPEKGYRLFHVDKSVITTEFVVA
ncbi:MAG: hypothetical protein QG656_2580 [Candidatus Hydrogenedentes bacterium]|nr:hypothetical protein [Candidatus Hydrogenedentota bacterium]